MIGETLAHYRIEQRLGSGGMGVVYRAHDERLHRTVAIKVIGDSETESTPDGCDRILDEARAASNLNHPNICTVYEAGEIEGRAFIAMEFIDGAPLSQMIPTGGLPLESVIRFGTQIAAALAHAHSRGVIHRDLKTANVVVSGEAGAKVLDFGLARRIDPADTEAITRSLGMGKGARLLGTLSYVAPEALVGQPADERSDIWALGVVLYEMAAGELPFKGRNQYELTAAILRSPAAPFPAHVPPILRTIVMRCLAKDPAQRYQRAGEARAALEAVQSDVHATLDSVAAADSRPRWAWLGGAALVGAAALAAWLFLRPSNPWERSAVEGRLTKIGSSDNRTFDPALSADGRMLAYIVETSDGRSDLYTARVSGGARVRLTDDDAREETPRFSPDGERIAFTRRDGPNALPEVRVLPALGGDVIAKVARASHPAWSPDGRQLACITRTDEGARMALAVSAVDGSDTRVLLWSDSVYPFLRSPTWSPDGRSIALVRGTGGIAAELWMVPAAGGEPRLLIDEPAAVFSDAPSFTSDGRGIVHASNRGGATNIWFLPLSGGPPVRLTTGAGPDESPSVAADGTVAFVNSRWRSTLELHDLAAGTSRTLLSHSPFVWAPVFSRDGREIAFSRSEVDGTWHIWTMPAEGGAARQLTSGEAGEVYPRYAPDGQTLFFHTWNAPRRIARLPLGERIPTLLSFDSQQGEAFADVSPDGRSIAFTRPDGDAERIYIASIDGGPARLLSPSAGTVPRWSPDGSRLAFSANRSYAGGIFVIGSDGTGERRLTGDGGWPVWWPDGRIGYNGIGAHGNQEIRIVSLDGQVETLDTIKLIGSNHPFSLSPDGHRLVVSNGVHVSDEIWLLEPPR